MPAPRLYQVDHLSKVYSDRSTIPSNADLDVSIISFHFSQTGTNIERGSWFERWNVAPVLVWRSTSPIHDIGLPSAK
jgi:hypothetical protein